jgi:AcrR family transcriptional regulator
MSPKISNDQKEYQKQRILLAAKQAFIKRGYDSTTMKDIVEETGMSRGWIYLYFQTKEEIFEGLLVQQDREFEQYISDLLVTTPSIWDVIEATFSQHLSDLQLFTNNSLLPSFYEYFLTGWRDEIRRDRLLKRYEDGITRFVTLLQMGVDRGEFSPIMSLENIARVVSSYQEGIITHTIAVGPEKANTEFQHHSLIKYLKQLLLLL